MVQGIDVYTTNIREWVGKSPRVGNQTRKPDGFSFGYLPDHRKPQRSHVAVGMEAWEA